jgi:NAD(P)H-dependent flavin oxidoreductase YrpB (nitropropane dioxygenase family)
MKTAATEMLDIEFPIFAFSHCRDVVAAVSQAGGFGVLGALAFSPEQLEIELKWIDEHVDGKPYGVVVVMPATYKRGEAGDFAKSDLEKMLPEGHKQWIEQVLARYDVPKLPDSFVARIDTLLGWSESGGRSHVEIALKHPIRLLVNALGPPPKDVIDRAHEHGVKVAALVGTVAQAQKQVALGVDVIVAQGWEAGGHVWGEVATLALVPAVVDAIAPVPVVAAGGIGDGRGLAAVLALGASAGWLGTRFVMSAEAPAPPRYRELLAGADETQTLHSSVFDGGWPSAAHRTLRNSTIAGWEAAGRPSAGARPGEGDVVGREADGEPIVRYDSSEVEAGDVGDIEAMSLWSGQSVGLSHEVQPAAEIVRGIAAAAAAVLAASSALVRN